MKFMLMIIKLVREPLLLNNLYFRYPFLKESTQGTSALFLLNTITSFVTTLHPRSMGSSGEVGDKCQIFLLLKNWRPKSLVKQRDPGPKDSGLDSEN